MKTFFYKNEKTRSDAMNNARWLAQDLTKETGIKHAIRHVSKGSKDGYTVIEIHTEQHR